MKRNKYSNMLVHSCLGVLFVSVLIACSSPDEVKSTETPPEAIPAAVASAEVLAMGEAVYQGQCRKCHDTGLAEATKLSNKEKWRMTLEKRGLQTLIDHAINGFEGEDGEMPPRGGKKELTDEEVKAAVMYMVHKIKEE